jgi:hypothetical protein
MAEQKTQTEAGDDYRTKNRIIKECLTDDAKRAKMNEAMATTIGREVYDYSLARVLLMPHLVKEGKCPIFSEGEHGPAVVVHLVETESRVLDCRAFRDSLREEERVTTVRDIEFIAMRGKGIRPSSFPLSNVCTVRQPELNGNAYNLIERARQRMKESLATDETKVAIRALSWVTARFGRSLWAKSAKTSESALKNAVEAVGTENRPVIVCSFRGAATLMNILEVIGTPAGRKVDPMLGFRVSDDVVVPVFPDSAVPEHMIYVVPSGEALGQMPIFMVPDVQSYDKPERLIKGWLCLQDQGMVFTNPKLTNAVYLGWKGLGEMVKNFFKRMSA